MEKQGLKVLTEEGSGAVLKQWYAASESMTLADLPAFLALLTTEYKHDYGTIVHAITAAGLAAMRAVNRSPAGGISGFQASGVMWEFVKRWLHENGPLRLVMYDRMLFPQYEEDFDRTITPQVFKFLQIEASKNLAKAEHEPVDAKVLDHWKSIAKGQVPFGYRVVG